MTDFRNQLDQKRERVYLGVCAPSQSGSTGGMYLFFIKVLFVFSVYDYCKGFGLHQKREDLTGNEDALIVNDQNETTLSPEYDLTTLLQEQPVAVVVELQESLLEKVKASLGEENKTNFPIRRTVLANFDSKGLRDVSVYNDTFEIRQAIMDLQSSNGDSEPVTPTIHVLTELLQRSPITDGFVLLITMSKPLDEDFAQNLITSLRGKKCQLSVFWAGNYPSDEYALLKDLADTTGGKFGFITSENNSDENLTEQYLPKSEFENLSEQIKFPEEQKDITAEEMPLVSRAAEQKLIQKTVVPLIVEVASGSSLEARPGTSSQIQFTVKNNINVALHAVFNARFNGIIQNVQPPTALIPPSASVPVVVNLQPIGAPQTVNAVGTLTLAAVAANTVTARSALISMTPQTITDYYAPKMSHKYEGDCSNYREPQNCEQGRWSLEATIQDEDSGLLKVLSEPYGLLFSSQFVAGSKTPVTVYYTATCCQPNVIIWAEDLKGNYVKKSFDVFNQTLLAGEIASIVVGVLLLLFIIIAIIVAVVLIKRRNRRNLIIPRPRSGSR